MKRILLLVFTITLFFNLNAQIQKGSIITGGSIRYSGNDHSQKISPSDGSVNDYNSNFLAIAPQIGFFTSESLLVGIGLTFEHDDYKHEYNSYDRSTYEEKRNLFFINPYITKYSKLKDKFYFTTRVNLMAGIGKENDAKLFEFRVNAKPGLTYFVSDKWALTCNVGQVYYNRKRTKLEEDSFSNKNIDESYGINLDFNTFTIGFQYVLNKKPRE